MKYTFPKGNQLRKGKKGWNKGLTKETDERVKRMADKKLGDNNPSKRPEVRLKMSLAKKGKPSQNKGRRYKIKNTENMAKPHLKGVPRTKEVKFILRQKARKRVLEGKHNFWKGGVTPIIKRIRTLPEYVEWRIKVYVRDNYKCIFGCNERKLVAHHIFFFSDIINKYKINSLQEALNCFAIFDTNNGLTICKKCHHKIHSENQINQFNKSNHISAKSNP